MADRLDPAFAFMARGDMAGDSTVASRFGKWPWKLYERLGFETIGRYHKFFT